MEVVKQQVLKLWTYQNLQVLFPLFVLQVSAVDAVSVPPLRSVSAGRGLIFVNKFGILGESKSTRSSMEFSDLCTNEVFNHPFN